MNVNTIKREEQIKQRIKNKPNTGQQNKQKQHQY